MEVLWLFQDGAFADHEQVQKLAYAAQELGDEVRVVKYVPFGGMTYDNIPKDKPVITYGSIAFIRNASCALLNVPVLWADWELLRCSCYYTKYSDVLVQRRWCMLPFGALLQQKDFIYEVFGDDSKDKRIFIRPDENTKRFDGGLVARDMFANWYEVVKYDCACTDIVVVSRPEDIGHEYRLLISNGEVVASSRYKAHNHIDVEEGCPRAVMALGSSIASKWAPHPLFVVDVAETKLGPLLLEIGSVNCAGLYACDKHVAAEVMHNQAVHDFQDLL